MKYTIKFLFSVLALGFLSTVSLVAQNQNLIGTWQGTLQPLNANRDLRTVIKITRSPEDESLKGVMYSIDQGARPIPVGTINQQGSIVKMTVPGVGGTYEGKLSEDGNTINGTWTQGTPLPLNLVRATSETAWEIPAPPAPLKPMAADAVPTFEVAAIKPSRPGAPGKAFRVNGRQNPFFHAAIPKTPQHRSEPTRFATLDNVLDMIEALDEPAATVVALAAFSGLRKSEIQGLKWSDLKGHELHVQRSAWRPTYVVEQTKTEASRGAVPVIPELAKYLAAHRNGNPSDGFIFTAPKMPARPLNLDNLARRVVCPALKAANIPWCGWHGFRRGIATILYELGVEAKTRQAILRHADVSVTEKHYVKPVSKVSAAAMAKFQGVLKAKQKARAAKNHRRRSKQ